ncbi:Wzy polymerase domain-containing protein [Variovorax sp. PvP013_2]
MDRHRAMSAVATHAALVAFPFLSPFVAGPSVNVWQLLGAWVCVAALVLLAGRSQGGGVAPARPLLCWLGVVLAAIAWRHGRDPALFLGAMGAVVAVALAACVGAGWARAPRTRPAALAWGLLAAGLASAVLGLCQYYGAATALVPWTTAPEVGQAYGNLRQRNQFATLVAMALAAALWLYADRAARGAPGRAASGAATAAIALLTLAAAASTSRTGLLQWMSISLAAAALAWGERRARARPHRLPHPALLLALIPAYFAAAWALPLAAGPEVEGMLRRLRDGLPEGHGRMLLWRNVVDLIALHPWAGWGWGELSFAHFDTLYAGPRFVEILDNAHNLPLHLAVELGVPASLAICGGFAVLALAARPWREREPTRLLAWAALGAMVLHSLLEYPLWYGPFQLVFGLCLGLLWPGAAAAAGRDAGEAAMVEAAAAGVARRPTPTSAWMQLPRAAAVLLLAAVAFAAWDYTRISQLYLARADRLAPWRDDTLAKLRSSWLFASQVRFAELSMTPVTSANAAEVHALAQRMLHFSPEPRVIVRLIDSATLLGRDDEAAALAARFKVAFPAEYARWLRGKPPTS